MRLALVCLASGLALLAAADDAEEGRAEPRGAGVGGAEGNEALRIQLRLKRRQLRKLKAEIGEIQARLSGRPPKVCPN